VGGPTDLVPAAAVEIVNCHIHTFTEAHTPDRYLPWPVQDLVRLPGVRRIFSWLARIFDPDRSTRLGRYAQIVEISYKKTQREVFEIVRGFYPERTRFVVLPMDMTKMNAGRVRVGIDEQHRKLEEVCAAYPSGLIVPFAAVDPRHDGIVERTIELIERHGFRGLKLYPPTGYHPFDRRLWPLYEYAEEHSIPVLTHCSPPAAVQYRGKPTREMLTDPDGTELKLDTDRLLEHFTHPKAYEPLLRKHPRLRLCLAHFGGEREWKKYLDNPWHSGAEEKKSWLAEILDMIRGGNYPGLWTDISYTLYANDEHVYLLKVLMSDPKVSERVLFGSDFYVVENAELEERRRSVRIRAVLGEQLFTQIAVTNPKEFLDSTRDALDERP
jgi:predicted TIM-barrel fold metal-dependent hydrolase